MPPPAPMMQYHASQATDRTPCPITHVDARRVWLRFGLVVTGCAIGGLGLGYLVAATVLDRILNN